MCACVRVRACVRVCACVGGCHVYSWGLESLRVGRWYSVGVFHYPNLAHERGKNETTSWFEYKAPRDNLVRMSFWRSIRPGASVFGPGQKAVVTVGVHKLGSRKQHSSSCVIPSARSHLKAPEHVPK